jgi:hypothetical protein
MLTRSTGEIQSSSTNVGGEQYHDDNMGTVADANGVGGNN